MIDRVKSSPELTLEEILGIRWIHPSFYELCRSRRCAQALYALEESIWTEGEVKEAVSARLNLLHEVQFRPEMAEFYTHLVKLTVAHELRKDPMLELQFPDSSSP